MRLVLEPTGTVLVAIVNTLFVTGDNVGLNHGFS